MKNLFKKSISIYLKIHVQFCILYYLVLKKMIKHITKRGGEVLNRLLLLLIVLPKVYMNSGSTHKAKDEVGRIWDLFKLSWAALNLSMSIMLLHWPCCFFFEAQDFFSSFCGFVYKISWEKLSRVELLLTYTAIRPFLITWMLMRPTMTYSILSKSLK